MKFKQLNILLMCILLYSPIIGIKPDYDNLVTQLQLLLKGKNNKLISILKNQMKSHAKNLEFEKAATIRNRIYYLEQILQSQHVSIESTKNYQIWDYVNQNDINYILVQEMVEGKLISQNGFYDENLSSKPSTTFIEQTFLNYISHYSIKTENIICSSLCYPIFNSLKNDLKLLCSIETPQRGIKKDLLDNCKLQTKVAASRIQQTQLKSKTLANPLNELATKLKLKMYPKKIIGCDISHLQSTNIVASAVCFINGSPAKHLYRKFSIKTVNEKSNDPKSMKEVVLRRLQLCIKENEELPDLFLIDGGIAQLNFAYQALQELNLESKIDIISLAKKHEEIYKLGLSTPLRFPKNTSFLHLCQQIRDESHRFAVSFQRQKRHKIGQKSILETIPGIGKQKLKALYSKFDSIEQIKFASIESLTSIKGITTKLAHEIKDSLSK